MQQHTRHDQRWQASQVDEGHSGRAPLLQHPLLQRLDRAAQHWVVRHDDTSMYWRQFGSGSPVVLIHGGHGSWLHWARNIEALATQHTVWVPDLPGFGESDSLSVDPHDPERLDLTVGALLGSVDALLGKNAEFGLAAFSFGAAPACRLAVRHPGVPALALFGPGGHGMRHRPRPDLINWRLPDPAARRAALQHNLRAFMLHDPQQVDDLSTEIHEYSCVRTRFRSKEISTSPWLEPVLEQFPRPTLLVWGEHDLTVDPAVAAERLTANAPHRRSAIITGAGHWVQFEAADSVNALLVPWFKQHLCQQPQAVA